MSNKNIPTHNLKESNFFVVETIEGSEQLNFSGIHRHNFYEILLFTHVSKKDVHHIDFVEYPISTQNVYILKPGQIHKMSLKNQRGFLIAIGADYFNGIQLNFEGYVDYLLPNVISPDKTDFQSLLTLIKLIFSEYIQKHRKNLLYAYMDSLVTLLISLYDKNHDVDKRVLSLLTLVEKHFVEHHNVEFYAQQVMLSEKRLNELTKSYMGLTVKQLVLQRLLLEAQRNISIGEQTFKEIAYNLGFNDSSYFTRFFKEQSGVTPEQFRLSIK